MIYVIFLWKKGGNKPASSANYLQGDTRLCRHPGMARGSQRGTGRQSHVVFLSAAPSVELQMTQNVELENKPGPPVAPRGTHWNGHWGGEHSKVSGLVGVWIISATGSEPHWGLGARNFSGPSLGNLKRLYLLFHKWLFSNVVIDKCYY